jgi:hypothetical protein
VGIAGSALPRYSAVLIEWAGSQDAVEEWTIVNKHNLLDRWMHSFHLHTWPFQAMR